MLRILTTSDKEEWFRICESMETYDVYHLPLFQKLAEDRGEGKASLFVYSEGQYTIALPLLIRKIDQSPLDNGDEDKWFDATSSYGYIGPICSVNSLPDEVIKNFQKELMNAFIELKLVSVFSRLHPLLTQVPLLSDFGECRKIGETVSVDLTIPETAQWAAYRRNHRSDIQKQRALGMEFMIDIRWEHYDEFINMYLDTMQRVQATDFYKFDKSYFYGLKQAFGDRLFLCFCVYQGKLISGGLVTLCNRIVEIPLAATPTEYLHLASIKLLFDSIRQWSISMNAKVLHLGSGGDSLFHFKTGFSKSLNQNMTWRLIVQPKIYDSLVRDRFGETIPISDNDNRPFFPLYRLSSMSSNSIVTERTENIAQS